MKINCRNTSTKIVGTLLAVSMGVGLLANTMTAFPDGTFAATNTFSDVPQTHWAHDAIERMVEKGVISGMGDGTYAPDSKVSYAQFATMTVEAFWPTYLFFDQSKIAPSGIWWERYVRVTGKYAGFHNTQVYQQYLNNGEQWGDFVLSPITRYDMAEMMYNLLRNKSVAMPSTSEISAAQEKISDWTEIPSQYQTAVAVAYAKGLLSGKDGGRFAGNDTLTRAEAAVVMDRLHDEGIDPRQDADMSWVDDETDNTTNDQTAEGYTPAASVNSIQPRTKEDAYPTKGQSDTPNNNGYYTEANVDLKNALLCYDFLDMVNEERRKLGLNELKWVGADEAEEDTLLRASELADLYSHSRPMEDGGRLWALEVICESQGVRTSKDIFNTWMNSPGHYATLMDKDVEYLCAAWISAKGKSEWIITVWGEIIYDTVQRNAKNNYV